MHTFSMEKVRVGLSGFQFDLTEDGFPAHPPGHAELD